MWPLHRKQTRPGQAGARLRLDGVGRLEKLRETGLLRAMVVGLVLAAGATAILSIGGRGPSYQLGQTLDQPILARVAFDLPNPAAPGQIIHIASGQEIASGIIDQHEMATLRAEGDAFDKSGQAGSFSLHLVGLSLVVLLITAGLGFYLVQFEPRVVRRLRNITAFSAVMLASLLAARLTLLLAWHVSAHILVTVAAGLLAVMTLTIVWGRRTALGAGFFLSLWMAIAARQGLPMTLVLLSGMTVAALMLNEIRTRGKLLAVGVATGLVMMVSLLAISLIGGQWDRTMFTQSLAALGAGVAASLILQGVLPLVERVFGIATAMTLLEYSDVSRPLLRRLATEAPGTFNHSLQLGSMAESAAEAIGANGLLARVGAYYHDIGKVNKPGYFVENQAGGFSRHAKLSPAMSLLIILGHVKDGLEMAREYGVPRVIRQFIVEHHGTTLVEYFFHAASQKAPGEQPVAEGQFRYPGPKPQSKEAAILMLCDAVEGASRSLAEPTPGRIEDMVRLIVNKRLHDGQLDECNLTLQELHLVEQSLVKSLCGFYHGRITYPSATEGQTRTA